VYDCLRFKAWTTTTRKGGTIGGFIGAVLGGVNGIVSGVQTLVAGMK
jgi:hypothetical protein